MPLPDFDLPDLPDLTDTDKYPTVSHAPFCTDTQPTDGRSCYTGTLDRPREYALPTEALGELQYGLNRLRDLVPIPPSLGVHCPTIATETTIGVGDEAHANQSVEQQNGDACLPKILQDIVFPCTVVNPAVSLTLGYPASASFDAPVNDRSSNRCIENILLNLKIPGCTGLTTVSNSVVMVSNPLDAGVTRQIIDRASALNGCRVELNDTIKVPCIMPTIAASAIDFTGSTGSPSGTLTVVPTGTNCNKTFTLNLALAIGSGGGGTTSGGGFQVGTVLSHSPPFGSAACAAAYLPGAEVPLIDRAGILGTAGLALSPVTYKIVNDTNSALTTGDIVEIAEAADLAGDGRILYNIVA